MKVRVELGLDFEGQHTLGWQPSNATGALEIPRATLERWVAEHEAFKIASLRWKRVIEEVEEQMYRAERERVIPFDPTPKKSTALASKLKNADAGDQVTVVARRSSRSRT